MRIFSFGGGVQSHAVLALAVQGKVQYDAFVFANVGDDSENPETLRYLEEVTKPFMEQHGLFFVEVRKRGKTLYESAVSTGNRTIPMVQVGVISARQGYYWIFQNVEPTEFDGPKKPGDNKDAANEGSV